MRLAILLVLALAPMVLAQPGPRTPNLKLKFTGDSAANDNFVKLDNFAGTNAAIIVTTDVDWSPINGGECDEVSRTVPGVSYVSNGPTGVVALGIPANAIDGSNSIFTAWVESANSVRIKHCCLGVAEGTCDPLETTWTIRVWNWVRQ